MIACRLMQLGPVDTVFYWVTDLDRSAAWYHHALGIPAGPRHGDWQELQVEGPVRFALHRGPRPPGGATAVVAFRVDDLDAFIDDLAARGIEPVDEPTDTGSARFVTFADPDANLVQLLERR